MVFPAAYGLLFTILLFRLLGPPFHFLPLALASADALENVTVAALALGYTGVPSPLAWMAASFTLLKTVLMAATLGAASVGIGRWLSVRQRR